MTSVILTLTIVGLAALCDIGTKRIPNLITLPAVVLGLIINTYYSGVTGLGGALAGTLAGISLLIIPFALQGIGAGDVKLLAAVGALNGFQFTLYTFIYSAIAGGIIALSLTLIYGRLNVVLVNVITLYRNIFARVFGRRPAESLLPASSNIRFSFGSAIFIGTVAAVWLG
ncbi:MAG: A24 family peptidase [Eubacteriales bacterium]